jgi:Sec-independent protein translocase protein TatA
VFGAGKLPSVMRDVGKGVKEFKNAQTEEQAAAAQAQSTSTTTAPPPATTASTTPVANGTTVTRPSEPAPRA